ncbi:MAG: hydrogenase iron-sulfur subunit [Candidatus Bathyarchaeum sp.]|nr:MAG: hydrogenase iron-sulfur subunit [Candidatus Bathyarchaeum sp.]
MKASKLSPKSNEDIRIGVYVCHCGKNIAGSVDCADVAEYASTLPHVVLSKHNLYTCSDPGQETIKKDVKEHNLNRVVVASCTPRLHEPTFRRTCEEAGLNKYLFEMANIREHCSWVHLYEPEKATAKAKDLVRMAVARSALMEPQEEAVVPVTRKALVIGGGVAGIQAALDLADTGYKVYLVEKSPSIGGKMAQIDKTFPTMDCSICILAPKMSDVGKHPNIELLTNSEVTEVGGYIGNFKVKVLKKPTYVTKDCTACGDCVDVCPVEIPNEFEVGLTWRKAIYIPFPQSVPARYLIDEKCCIGLGENTCAKCKEVCGPDAIIFNDKAEEVELKVGTIIVATGLDVFDPVSLMEYGYLRFPNTITSLEFERLINAGGPTGGRLVRPSNLRIPKKVAFIQCIGSRSEKRGNPYCSNVCCMNTIKDALLIKEHWPDVKIYVFYIDIRAIGKGFEDLFRRAKEAGVIFIRGLPAEIIEDRKSKNLWLVGENTLEKEIYTINVGMVVLSIGLRPRDDSGKVQQLLRLSKTSDGFFMEAHPKLRPVDTPTGGVFLAGCAEGPKDIKDSVTQASAAAARAGILMAKGKVTVEALTPKMLPEKCMGCGLCARVCPYNAITVDKEKKIAKVVEAACAGCGTCGAECSFNAIEMRHFTDEQIYAQINAATEKDADKKIIAFCCNWCSYAGADFAGVSRMQYPPSVRIIRTMCSGRVSTKFVERAFSRGAAAVLVAGCHLNDCHYINANYQTKKRVEKLWKKMERLGLDKNRLQLAWISAAEGAKFASKIKEMQRIVEGATKEEIEKTVDRMTPKKLQVTA